jgi:hypothetical protein
MLASYMAPEFVYRDATTHYYRTKALQLTKEGDKANVGEGGALFDPVLATPQVAYGNKNEKRINENDSAACVLSRVERKTNQLGVLMVRVVIWHDRWTCDLWMC